MIFVVILLVFSGIFIGSFGIFMIVRNEWVFDQRIKVLLWDMNAYHNLPTYTEMVWTFWIWDMRKFLPQSNQTNHA